VEARVAPLVQRVRPVRLVRLAQRVPMVARPTPALTRQTRPELRHVK
jgi:hypothetical protein